MIKISYSRESVCAADDYCNCTQYLSLPDDTVLEELIRAIQRRRDQREPLYCSLPCAAVDICWVLHSNVGDIANLTFNKNYDMFIEYLQFDSRTPLKETGIKEVHGTHHLITKTK